MPHPTLTEEQILLINQIEANYKMFLEGVLEQMKAENEKAAKPKRASLGYSHDETDNYNYRLPLDMGEAIKAMSDELPAYSNHIVYHLLRYAITSGFTDQMESIVRLNSFQQYRNSFKK